MLSAKCSMLKIFGQWTDSRAEGQNISASYWQISRPFVFLLLVCGGVVYVFVFVVKFPTKCSRLPHYEQVLKTV
jgi:hypothetical protein